MARQVRDMMTTDPVILDSNESVRTAAERMRDQDIGDVLISDGTELRGIVTDRDIVVRVLADGREADSVTLGDICSSDLDVVSPDDDLDEVIRDMRRDAIRRVPVVENDEAVGILSIGDLAIELDERSALADISAARANE